MNGDQYQRLAIGAAILAVIAAIATGRLPRWLRLVLVAGLIAVAAGIGVFGYRYLSKPTSLTIVAGSIDGDTPRILTALATRLAATNAPVRLKVIDKGLAAKAVEAFAAGEADLVATRSDIGDLSAARTVVVFTNAVVLVAVPPDSQVDSFDGLKGKTIGVIGADTNHRVVEVISKEYDLERARVRFRNLTLDDAQQVVRSKQVQAVLVVMPITQKYLAMLRDIFPHDRKRTIRLVPIEAAGAIAAIHPVYESYDLPKGTIRGAPPVPDDDLTTLRVPIYLIANAKLSSDVVASLTKAIMDVRRDLLPEYPLLAQIAAPSTDKDAFIPVHPGAAAYFDGDQQSFFDKYGDFIFYGSMLFGGLTSIAAAGWKFLTNNEDKLQETPVMRLQALIDRIDTASDEAELAETEKNINGILKSEFESYAAGRMEAADTAVLGMATQRLEHLIAQRRAILSTKPV